MQKKEGKKRSIGTLKEIRKISFSSESKNNVIKRNKILMKQKSKHEVEKFFATENNENK